MTKPSISQKKNKKAPRETLTVDVPITLKNAFKAKTSAEGKKIRDVICEFMEAYIKR